MLGLSAILAGLSGLASAAAPAYWWYMGLRVCSGVAAASMTLAARALAIEPVGPTWRGMAGVASCFFNISGGLVTVLIAFLVSQFYTLFVTCCHNFGIQQESRTDHEYICRGRVQCRHVLNFGQV